MYTIVNPKISNKNDTPFATVWKFNIVYIE